MLISSICAAIAVAASGTQAVEFHRTFIKGEKASYKVLSEMTAEVRNIQLETWMPEDIGYLYNFDYEVLEMKADGICVMRYKRPVMTELIGETMDSPPKRKDEKVAMDYNLTVSPINEILDMKENAKPKPPAKPGDPKSGGGKSGGLLVSRSAPGAPPQLQAFLSQFVGEIYRLALFVGSMDSSLDFAPTLPVIEVEHGDTWKKTVGFQPQRLQGKGDKLAVQRLDYTYTYKGLGELNGKKVHKIEAVLTVKTDLGAYIHQLFNVKSEQTGLKEIPLEFTATVMYDLDLKTHQTLRASGSSKGGFKVIADGIAKPVQEERFNSTSTLTLIRSTR